MEAKIKDIASDSRQLSLFIARLANSPGPAAVHEELQELIRDTIQSLYKQLEYATTFVEDEESLLARQEQKISILKYTEDLGNQQTSYRKALLKAKRNLETNHAANRNLLFDGRTGVSARRDANTSNAVLQASSDVTSELRKTHELMSNELSKSALSQELLQQSSQTLESLHAEYSAFETILVGSKRILKELENADRIDRLWIWASLSFFLTVVVWILYRRILSKGVNLLVWLFGGLLRSRKVEAITKDAILVATTSITSAAAAVTSLAGKTGESASLLHQADESVVLKAEEAELIQRAMVKEPTEDTPILHLADEEINLHDEL